MHGVACDFIKMYFKTLLPNQSVPNQVLQLFTQNSARYLSILNNVNSSKRKCNVSNRTLHKNSAIEYYKKYFISTASGNRYKFILDRENGHCHNIMQSIPLYENNLITSISKKIEDRLIDEKTFEDVLSKNWRTESASAITEAFKQLCYYALENHVPLSDKRFDKLVDGLMDKCQNLTDDELSELLYCVSQYPKCESPSSHNIHDIWSALDDMCCQRVQDWPVAKLLLFSDHWYKLGLAKYGDYMAQAIKRLCRRITSLSPTEFTQTLFYINVRRKHFSMFDFECRLEKCISELSLDELAIVSMAFFKTETSIKESFLLSHMLNRLLEQTSTVHEITLTAILKIIRYSQHLKLVDKLNELQTKLVPEIDRLSILACVHIALAGTSVQLFHPEVLTKISEKFVKSISATRLKDLERLIFALTLFKFNPKTEPNIFDTIFNEIKKPERQEEIKKHPRCFACLIHYLGLQEIYSYEFLNKVLDPEFIVETYGNNNKNIGREILFLNSSIDIDCPDYIGNRLKPKLQERLTRWGADWIPRKNQKHRLTAADALMLAMVDAVEVVHEANDFIHIDYILPHFPKPDIIICKDKDGRPVGNVKKYYEKYKIGDLMKPELSTSFKWYAILVGGWNLFNRGTTDPVGTLSTKIRQLEKIGYIPIVIPWGDFMHLSRKEREDYLSNKLKTT